jgi:hypothetical protein
LFAAVQKYIEAGNAFTSVGRRFASELMHLEGESWYAHLTQPIDAVVQPCRVHISIHSSRLLTWGLSMCCVRFTRLGDLAPALVRFGEAFDEIQNYTDVVVRRDTYNAR